MSLKELFEKLNNIKASKAEKQKELDGMRAKLKSATDDDLKALEDSSKKLTDEISALISSEEETQEQIDEAEKQLKELAEASRKEKNKQKGTEQMEYLKTKQAGIDFAQLLVENKGMSSKDLRKTWEDNLKEKGVTGLDNLLPEPVLLAIEEAFTDYTGILNHVSKDPRYAARVVLQSVKNFGKGHKKGKTKKNAEFDFAPFNINSDTVYIKVDFDYADMKKDVDGKYFNYAMGQLATSLIRAVERAVVIGDGLPASDDDKITEIKSIAEETKAELFETQEIDTAAASYTNEQMEAIVAGVDKLAPTTQPVLITSKAIARKLKLAKDADGKYTDPQPFAPISTVGNNIQGFVVYVYDWMDGADNPIIAFADKAYTLIGDSIGADRFDEYDITVNKRDIEVASVMGGRLSDYKAAVKFTEKAGA